MILRPNWLRKDIECAHRTMVVDDWWHGLDLSLREEIKAREEERRAFKLEELRNEIANSGDT